MFEVQYELRANWGAVSQDESAMNIWMLLKAMGGMDADSEKKLTLGAMLLTLSIRHFVYDIQAGQFLDKEAGENILGNLLVAGNGEKLQAEISKLMDSLGQSGGFFEEKDLNLSEDDLNKLFGLDKDQS